MEEDIRYPVGKFIRPQSMTAQQRAEAIIVLANSPQTVREAVRGLSEAQLDTPYREGGWTARQVVHHLADSNAAANERTRWALTEDWPAIKPFDEHAWAQLEDARTLPVEVSLQLLEALQTRWVVLLCSLQEKQWTQCGYKHPVMGEVTLEQGLALHAWHNRHHTAHIIGLRQRMGW